MRLSQVCTVLFVLVLVILGHTDAGRRRKKNKNRSEKPVCKYKGRPSYVGDCNEATNKMSLSFDLKVAKRGAQCQPQQVKLVDCGDTTYLRGKKKNRMNRKNNKKLMKGCRYERKGTAGPCDPSTNKMEFVRQLRGGQASHCPSEKKKFRKCNKRDRKPKGCRFDKSEWSECGPNESFKHRRLTPKPGFPDQCKAFTQSRPCDVPGANTQKCKYKGGSWSECDSRTNTVTRVWTLKNGDPNVCPRTKNISRKCRTCKFQPGEWSECDEEMNLMTRVDKLIKGSTRSCDATRTITKKCKKACKYNWGNWTLCDPETNQRSRTGSLLKGDGEKCESTSTMYRPCTNRNGEERCFFGPWADFGPCQNGVMIKRRDVVQGGVACERKAVVTQACDEASN